MQSIFVRATLVLLLAMAPAVAGEAPLVKTGTLDIDQTRVGFLISANGGGGVLHYRGRNYPFSVGGLGIGGIGISKLEATGTVYNMARREQFAGAYSLVRTGYALGDSGSGKLWLKNGDGVVLELRGKSKGIALSLGADVVNISFK